MSEILCGAIGSIPAHVGESLNSALNYVENRVYPRLCGGIRPLLDMIMYFCGLSPPMRGNPG